MGHLLDTTRRRLADEVHGRHDEIRRQRAAELADAVRAYTGDRSDGHFAAMVAALDASDRAAAW